MRIQRGGYAQGKVVKMYYPDRMIRMFGAREVRHYAKKFGLPLDEAYKILKAFIETGQEPDIENDAALHLINAYQDRIEFYRDEFDTKIERTSKIIVDLANKYLS